MKRIALLIAGAMTPSLVAWSDARAQAPINPSLAVHELAKKVVLSKARTEIAKLGITLPDEMMMKGLEGLGFKPKVTTSGNGWKVAHPLGHPWAISWVHLEMDSRGKVLRHRFDKVSSGRHRTHPCCGGAPPWPRCDLFTCQA